MSKNQDNYLPIFVDGYVMGSKARYDADLTQYLFPANGANADAVCEEAVWTMKSC